LIAVLATTVWGFPIWDLVLGALAAITIGLGKTAIPGAGMLAVPLVAAVFDGRPTVGATLIILITADLFAVRWYREHTRWDVLRSMVPWVLLGYVAGACFFIVIGSGGRSLDITMGAMILLMVVLQGLRMIRRSPARPPTTGASAFYGTTGGFATFVSNNAGPIINSHLLRLGLEKSELVGTAAWFYFAVNIAKFPIYVALGWWTGGGGFFTVDAGKFAVMMLPIVVLAVLVGRRLFHIVPTQVFVTIVLVLAAAASIKLLAGW